MIDNRDLSIKLGQTQNMAWDLAMRRAEHQQKLHDMQWIQNEYTIIMFELWPQNLAMSQVFPQFCADKTKEHTKILQAQETQRNPFPEVKL
jgi:hypothetical protein